MRIFYVLVLTALLTGCDIFDKEETIPSWIIINSSDLETNGTTEGAPTSDIVDATVFVNDFFVGTFELPAMVPILEEGSNTITVAAGIRNNGLGSNRVIYPFYDFYEENVDLVPGEMIPIGTDTSLTYSYFSPLNFFLENFEGIGSVLQDRPANTALYGNTEDPENVRSGVKSLEVILTAENNIFEVQNTVPIGNITTGNPIYLEIDFKGNHPLEIGLIGVTGGSSQKVFAAGINPQEEWTKVYIELTNEVGALLGAQGYQFYLESRLQGITSERRLYIDNIKLVYF